MGLKGPLVHPGSFFGIYYRIEKMAEDGILEDTSEATEGVNKREFSGGS